MKIKFNIRGANGKDLPSLFEIYEEAFRWRIEKVFAWGEQWHWRYFEEEWQKYESYVLESTGELIGYYQIEFFEGELSLVNIALKEKFRGQGIGSGVLTSLKERCSKESLELKLSVFKIDTKAIHFYKSQDLVIFDETDETYKMQWLPKIT